MQNVLIANRGEIAVRLMRTIRELGLRSIALYADIEADAKHVMHADEVHSLRQPYYLDSDQIIGTALRVGADSVHPGYGFLSEDAEFATACQKAGLTFIGPNSDAIAGMANKLAARRRLAALGIRTVPGSDRPVTTASEARYAAELVGWPVILKAAAGGGGRAMKIVPSAAEIEVAFEAAMAESRRFFLSDEIYIERFFEGARHVEVQILRDKHRNLTLFPERDCTVQRRYQKLIEESPAPGLTETVRQQLRTIATQVAEAIDYDSVGTVECLVVDDTAFFLEVNTRLQVEHPVTEILCGVDLVREQIRVARGEVSGLPARVLPKHGWAIECRINAESAAKGFFPSPGVITDYHEPGGPGVRVDAGVRMGSKVLPQFDSLIAKLIVVDDDRSAATARMIRALTEYQVGGVHTLVPFHTKLLQTSQWEAGEACRDLLGNQRWLSTV